MVSTYTQANRELYCYVTTNENALKNSRCILLAWFYQIFNLIVLNIFLYQLVCIFTDVISGNAFHKRNFQSISD